MLIHSCKLANNLLHKEAWFCIYLHTHVCICICMCTSAYIYILLYAHKNILTQTYPYKCTCVILFYIFSEFDLWFHKGHLLGSSALGPFIPAGPEAACFSGAGFSGLPVFLRRLIIKTGGRKGLVLES